MKIHVVIFFGIQTRYKDLEEVKGGGDQLGMGNSISEI